MTNKKSDMHEKININSNTYNTKDDFDFTDKNIVDVEYEEIKK
jgi:hypothetical protein